MSTEPEDSNADRRIEVAVVAFLLVFVWAMVASLCQGGWPGFFAFWKAYGFVALCAILLSAVYAHLKQGLLSFLALMCVAFVPAWFWFADSWGERLWDFLALLLALGVTLLLLEGQARFLRRGAGQLDDSTHAKPKKTRTDSPSDVLVFTLAFWVLASISVSLRSTPLPADPSRFQAISPERALLPDRAAQWRHLRIGLALSGGGYRAAVFHAGVLQSVEALGLRVGNLSTVSGGSIIGAYYAVGGDPAAFATAVAAGRFNLKRQLMQAQNALRLPFPIRIPGLATELFPWASFDRLDVQRGLLQSVLFGRARRHTAPNRSEAGAGAPLLMIAATDLNYGFQIGLLSDGVLKLGHAGDWSVYRNARLETFGELDLADRVAISGAFPMAFPARALKIRVDPLDATGRGTRELLLADGGIRDNSGYDLLRVAHLLSREQEQGQDEAIADYRMPQEWRLDLGLVSDAGALFGVLEEDMAALEMLTRMFDVAAIETDSSTARQGCAGLIDAPLRLSPATELLSPDRQFKLKPDDSRRASLADPISIQFTPHRYPAPIVQALIDLLPQTDGAIATRQHGAQQAFDVLLPEWETRSRDRAWHRSYQNARAGRSCDPPAEGGAPPAQAQAGGTELCAAIRLQEIIKQAVASDIEAFRDASTLEDTPPPETVHAIERLGRMLVYLRWPLLSRQLDAAVACKAEHAQRAQPSSLNPVPHAAMAPVAAGWPAAREPGVWASAQLPLRAQVR